MKRFFLGLLVACLAVTARSDDAVRNVQTELKSQGFYYGDLDGKFSSETSAAIKRYQIRNGMEVTGTLTKQTVESLGLAKPDGSSPPPAPPAAQTMPKQQPPVNLRREETVQDSDRNFLRRNETAPQPPESDPSVVPPPARLNPPAAPGEEYASIFARTPFAIAPLEVQQTTLRKAQTFLAREGVYPDAIDGLPGPATEEAVLAYQRRSGLPLTGRLDLQTLNRMHLLPGRGGPPLKPFYGESRTTQPQRPLRGVWVE